MRERFRKHRAAFAAAVCAGVVAASVLPLTVASCRAQRPSDDAAGYERLRALTRGGALPPEQAVAQLAAEFAGTRTGALARLAQARVRLNAGDHAGAASLLQSADFKTQTAVADHALWLRADALEKLGRRAEARAALEELARDHPDSLRAREATLRAGRLLAQDGQPSAVPLAVQKLAAEDDAEALLLTARAFEQAGEREKAVAAARRLFYYAPVSSQNDADATAVIARIVVPERPAPPTPEEAATRAEKLFRAKRYADAVSAYGDAFMRFPATATPQARLRRGAAAFNAKRAPETVESLSAVPASSAETRAEALHYLAQHYARARQWPQAHATAEEMRASFPRSEWTMRGLVAAGHLARDMKMTFEAQHFYRLAVQLFPGAPEVAGAQFELAWAAHEAKNFQESSRLLTEHLASYADRNTDNRGRAGYWAARDTERAGRLAEARALYEGMLARYDANWYGYLSKQRLEQLTKAGTPAGNFPPDSPVARAVANLKPVTAAEETASQAEAGRALKAEHLAAAGADDLAHAELDKALEAAPTSPRLNLAKAKLHRARTQNVEAFNVLRRSFPDYSQMKPEELTREEWDVFYPLAFWDAIKQEATARDLDPYTVAGLIRQESVFNPRAVSHADAYGLMQLLVPTARMTARRAGVDDAVTVERLLGDPRLNIRLGTSYLREQMDKYGRIEYVAAAYNAGPGRVVQWRASLPLQMDEWAEAIPFRETRGYVQGVVRNSLQYRRLYDEQGRFRPEVGSRAVRPDIGAAPASNTTRPRRVSNEDEE